jgi:hypothetical protein
MQHIETGPIFTDKLYPIIDCRSSQATGIFLCCAPDLLSFRLSSIHRHALQAVISQDKVAEDFPWA